MSQNPDFGSPPSNQTYLGINSAVVRAKKAILSTMYCRNLNSVARYLLLFDSLTVPGDGTGSPVAVMMIPGITAATGDAFREYTKGLKFDNGLCFVFSSTAPLPTAATASDATVIITADP